MTDTEGWAPMNGSQRAFHYYRENQRGFTRSLCGRYRVLPYQIEHLALTRRESGERDCVLCARVIESERAS